MLASLYKNVSYISLGSNERTIMRVATSSTDIPGISLHITWYGIPYIYSQLYI